MIGNKWFSFNWYKDMTDPDLNIDLLNGLCNEIEVNNSFRDDEQTYIYELFNRKTTLNLNTVEDHERYAMSLRKEDTDE